MSSLNKVILVGRLGADPEVKQVNDTTVARLSVATTEYWTDKSGQKQTRTEWHRVVVWGRQADNCGKYLKKGAMATIEGKIQTRSWEDPQGGKRYATEIKADSVGFLSGTNGGTSKPKSDSLIGLNDNASQSQEDEFPDFGDGDGDDSFGKY